MTRSPKTHCLGLAALPHVRRPSSSGRAPRQRSRPAPPEHARYPPHPSSMRRSRRASAPSLSPKPIAFSTWLGPTLPDEQADPADTRDAGEIEGDLRRLGLQARDSEECRVGKPLARRCRRFPRRAPARSTDCFDLVAQCRDVRRCRASPSRASRAAAPKPAIAGRFSVPARWPLSWPPPVISGAGIIRSDARDDRADALRAADLVRRQDQDNPP